MPGNEGAFPGASRLGVLSSVNYKTSPLRAEVLGAPGWRSQLSVQLQPGHDLAVREFEPRVGLWLSLSQKLHKC